MPETFLRHRRANLPAMLYTAKCYWPGVTAGELEEAAERAVEATAQTRSPNQAVYLGSLLFPGDDLVLCLFEATSRGVIKRVSDQAAIPCERVMDARWFAPDRHDRSASCDPPSR